MLLHDSRGATRVDSDGGVVLLEDQDRSLWNCEEIREGLALVESALRAGAAGAYALQAAIAAVHAQAERASATDWKQIVGLYEALLRVQPSPVVELNHAAAVAMAHGPAEGLRLLDRLEGKAELREYYLLPAARGDFAPRSRRASARISARSKRVALCRPAPARRPHSSQPHEPTLPHIWPSPP